MIYQIDLLKGKGIPAKSRPLYVMLACSPFLITALAAIMIMGSYIKNKVDYQIYTQRLASYNSVKNDLQKVRHFVNNISSDKEMLDKHAAEIAGSINAHMQWSPVMQALINNLPPSINLNQLNVKRQVLHDKVKDKEGKPFDVIGYQYTLIITVSGENGFGGNEAVKEFVQNLKKNPDLAATIEDIRVFSNQVKIRPDTSEMIYELECRFRRSMLTALPGDSK